MPCENKDKFCFVCGLFTSAKHARSLVTKTNDVVTQAYKYQIYTHTSFLINSNFSQVNTIGIKISNLEVVSIQLCMDFEFFSMFNF